MTADERFADDPVLSRVARARPALPEDLSASGQPAAAIAARVLAVPRQAPSRRTAFRRPALRRARHLRLPAVLGTCGLVAAAACLALVITGVFGGAAAPEARAADVFRIRVAERALPRWVLHAVDRTQLGRVIQREHGRIQQEIRTGDAAQNRAAIANLTRNRSRCEQAAGAVAGVQAPARYRVAQRGWILGVRLQALGDTQVIAALNALNAGRRTVGQREIRTARQTLRDSHSLTNYAENVLIFGDPGPPPRVPQTR